MTNADDSSIQEPSPIQTPSNDPTPPTAQPNVPAAVDPPPEQAPKARKPSQFEPPTDAPQLDRTTTRIVQVFGVLCAVVLIGIVIGGVAFVWRGLGRGPQEDPFALPPPPNPLSREERSLEQQDGDAFIPFDPQSRPPLPNPSPEMLKESVNNDALALIPVVEDTVVAGAHNAPVTIVMFIDVTCPHSARATAAIQQLAARFPQDVRISVRYLTTSTDPNAILPAAAAAATFTLFGSAKYWALLAKTPTIADILQQPAMELALESDIYQARVRRDINLARQLMVRTTPTFFVNGMHLAGEQAVNAMERLVLAERHAVATSGIRPELQYSERVRFYVTSGDADN